MKRHLTLLLTLISCSSWNQKDFENDLRKPAEEIAAITSTNTEEKLLEKFEVLPAPSSETGHKQKQVSDLAKLEKKEISKKKLDISRLKNSKENLVEISNLESRILPVDYPENLLEINSKAKKVWNLYKPNHYMGQKFFLDIHYLGMTVGKMMVENQGKKMINQKEVWHFHARFKSAPFYRNIYELDDTVDTYVMSDNFLSSRYSLIQRETKQDIDDLQLHDRDQLKTFWFYHQKKSNGDIKDKKIEKYIPFFSTDPFSVLFFYQGLPLKDGDLYEIPIVNKSKILILKSYVEGREILKTEKGRKKSIRIHATTNYSGATLKSGDLYFWFSDDNQRTLLKAQAKIKIGYVTADIVDK